MANDTIPSQEKTRTRIALEWLTNHRNTLTVYAADWNQDPYNAVRRKKLMAAIDTILEEFGSLRNCGTCAHYDTATRGYGTCAAPLPVAIRGVGLESRPMFTIDGADCPCWKKKN